MLTPPRHLISLLDPGISRGQCLVHSLIFISYRTNEIDDCSLFMSFYSHFTVRAAIGKATIQQQAVVFLCYMCFFSIQNSEIHNVSNAIIIQKANRKSSVAQHGPPTNAKLGSGAVSLKDLRLRPEI
jgi:hypothetical protein